MSARADIRDSERFCRAMLPLVSRTFAISIRLLPGELGRSVTCAYLLCRIADTVEDAGTLDAMTKARLLRVMETAFDDSAQAAALARDVATLEGDPAHIALIRGTTHVFALWRDLRPDGGAAVRRWVIEMITGMREFVETYPEGIRIQTIEEYERYCYIVAGTVGYMLTDLWRAHVSSIDEATYGHLRQHARAFGEALQTVNILKDVAIDAERENSIYVPEALLRMHGSSHATLLDANLETSNHAALAVLIEKAWRNLDEARTYLLLIPRRALAARAFCVLPLLYAYATLRDLTRSHAMLRPGGVVKITRKEVRWLMAAGLATVPSNTLLRALIARVRRRPLSAPAAG